MSTNDRARFTRVGQLLALTALISTTLLAGAGRMVPAAHADTQYGALTFPQDENAQPASWDYWWGAGNLITTNGDRYILGMAYTDIEGDTAAGYQLIPMQGPYKGQAVLTMEGPTNWGHPGEDQSPGRFVFKPTAWTSILGPRALAVSTLTGSVQCGPSRVVPSVSWVRISWAVMAASRWSFLKNYPMIRLSGPRCKLGRGKTFCRSDETDYPEPCLASLVLYTGV